MDVRTVNPYYGSDKLGWALHSLERDLSYEFDILAFWITSENEVYTAADSGCSCPTPFEGYEGTTPEEIKAKLTRVASLKQATELAQEWLGPVTRRIEERRGLAQKWENKIEPTLRALVKRRKLRRE